MAEIAETLTLKVAAEWRTKGIARISNPPVVEQTMPLRVRTNRVLIHLSHLSLIMAVLLVEDKS